VCCVYQFRHTRNQRQRAGGTGIPRRDAYNGGAAGRRKLSGGGQKTVYQKTAVQDTNSEARIGNGLPVFERYVGVDYSGAQTPTASLKGLRVYAATPP
jgi:hypothetical protein